MSDELFKKCWIVLGVIIGIVLLIMMINNIKRNWEGGEYMNDWPCGVKLRNGYYRECKELN